ncbi:MAG: helix-turn-helix transcriptional regulator, partial [Chitinophagaceae bacterium]|nr:helix-turn-helix transcriptional regulator [Chitinophagaceae bacterium]
VNTPFNLSTEKSKQVIRKMNELMESEQPFLKTGYSIKTLAGELKIPSYQVSALLNRKMGTNFNDYLNHYRVKYSQELIRSGVTENLNLKGLSSKCGFNNRNTFTSAFKKFTGHTPSDYAKHYQHYQ